MLKLDEVTDAYRIVHSEADGLSGLVIDRFGSNVVIEFFSAGMFRLRSTIMDVLSEPLSRTCRFYWFAEEHVGKQESFDCRPPEPPPPGVITEHGAASSAWHRAASTRRASSSTSATIAGRWAASAAGKRVLDLCCNSGGFAVYAKALGGANEVVGLDLDEQAIDLAKQNAEPEQGARSASSRPICSPGCAMRFPTASASTWSYSIRPS